MDPDSLKKTNWMQHRRHGLSTRCTSFETSATLTYSRFRTLLRFPVVCAQNQETSEPRVNASLGKETDRQETDRLGAVASGALDNKDNNAIASSVLRDEVLEYIRKETGRERLREFFRKDGKGMRSPEMYVVIAGTLQSALFGGAVAGFIGARIAKERFIKKHYIAQYETKFFGLRGYYDAMFVGASGFGMKWAARLGFFTGTFLMISSSIAIYRNKTSVLEYAVGGAVTGSLFRVNMGLRGMFAAGLLGGSFGAIAGLLVMGASIATGESQEARRFNCIQERLLEKRKYEKDREAREQLEYLPPTAPS